MSIDFLPDRIGERQVIHRRLTLAVVIIALLFLAVIGRTAYLQVAQYDYLSARSQDNRVRLAPVDPTRGIITDRQGQVLAENRSAFSLVIIPEQVNDMEALLAELDQLLDLNEAEIAAFHESRRRSRSFQEIPLRLELSEPVVAELTVNRHRFQGVEVKPQLVRHYPFGKSGSHVLGHVGRISAAELDRADRRRYRNNSFMGKAGVEAFYEDRLHGRLGVERIETNALGRPLAVLERDPPVPGNDIQLTLDMRLQQVAEAAMGDHRGAIVALDPNTGEVLALASMPTFDPNILSRGLDRASLHTLNQDWRQPLFNRATQGRYPPGSVIKPLLGLAGIAGGFIDPDEIVHCGGRFNLPNVSRTWRDWRPEGHGPVDFIQAVAQSCDIYYYQLAHAMGIGAMHEWMSRFGYGVRTGIDLRSERDGVMPSRDWKRRVLGEPWYTGETINTGIGQGFMLATPLQMATTTALIANRGVPIRPRLVASQTPALPPVEGLEPLTDIDESLWELTVDSMIETVHGPRGTARATGAGLGYQMAGKTGTAQVIGIGEDEEYDEETLDPRFHDHALFTAFAPAENPEIVVAVMVEHGGSGSATAAPMARQVIDAWLNREESEGELARR